MKHKNLNRKLLTLLIVCCTFMIGCAPYQRTILFPPANEIFFTSGDGDIQKPYTPIGEYVYSVRGFRLPLPIIGLIAFTRLDPERVLREKITPKIKEVGGDGMINMKILMVKDDPGFLGMFAKPGYIQVTGTIIRR